MNHHARAFLLAGALAGGIAATSGCALETAVGGEAPGAVIFDRPDQRPATESVARRLIRLGRELLDRAGTSRRPVPLLWPELHERTLNGLD